MLEGLSESLTEAVADAVRGVVGQVVREAVQTAVQQVLNNPDLLRAVQAQAQPTGPASPNLPPRNRECDRGKIVW